MSTSEITLQQLRRLAAKLAREADAGLGAIDLAENPHGGDRDVTNGVTSASRPAPRGASWGS